METDLHFSAVCLSISLVILNCWMISIKCGREAKVFKLISFLQVFVKVTVWIEGGDPTHAFRNSLQHTFNLSYIARIYSGVNLPFVF